MFSKQREREAYVTPTHECSQPVVPARYSVTGYFFILVIRQPDHSVVPAVTLIDPFSTQLIKARVSLVTESEPVWPSGKA